MKCLLILVSLGLLASLAAAQTNMLEQIAANPDLSTLNTLLASPDYVAVRNLLNEGGPLTFFAPSNAAIDAANLNVSDVARVAAVLRYHLIASNVTREILQPFQFPETLVTNQDFVNLGDDNGQVLAVTKTNENAVTINFGIPGSAQYTASVTSADILASNGVIHIVDRVFTLPRKFSEMANEVGVTNLLTAASTANLADVIDNTPQITIFAPVNQAFANVSALTEANLAEILKYHVANEVLYSTSLTNGQTYTTLQGKTLTVTIADNVVRVNEAVVTQPNILLKNGVLHVIDRIIPLESAAFATYQLNFLALLSVSFLAIFASRQ